MLRVVIGGEDLVDLRVNKVKVGKRMATLDSMVNHEDLSVVDRVDITTTTTILNISNNKEEPDPTRLLPELRMMMMVSKFNVDEEDNKKEMVVGSNQEVPVVLEVLGIGEVLGVQEVEEVVNRVPDSKVVSLMFYAAVTGWSGVRSILFVQC